jgi:hypothetical protein
VSVFAPSARRRVSLRHWADNFERLRISTNASKDRKIRGRKMTDAQHKQEPQRSPRTPRVYDQSITQRRKGPYSRRGAMRRASSSL